MSSQDGIKAALNGKDALFTPSHTNTQMLPMLFLSLLEEYQENPDRREAKIVEV